LFVNYGEVLDIFVKQTDPKLLEELPENKRKAILDHQFAFITFKDPRAAMKVVDEFSYLKVKNKEYNNELLRVVENLRKASVVEERHLYRFACYLMENENKEYSNILTEMNRLNMTTESFKKHLIEYDDNYITKDKADRLECYQSLKKKERVKKLKLLYEKIKKQIKEKYKFCNLYVKNLPNDFNDNQLKDLFIKFGPIRSCKTVKKELAASIIGLKRSVRVFGYVCFFEKEHAHEAKTSLHSQKVFQNLPALFVDYHKTKQDRTEFIKLKLLNNQKNQKMNDHMRGMNNVLFNPQMLRKFPPQTAFIRPNFPIVNMNLPQQKPYDNLGLDQMDPNTKRDFLGDKLFTKLSTFPQFANCSELFSKIVGIFLELDMKTIIKLIEDNNYFYVQVNETIRQLKEKFNEGS